MPSTNQLRRGIGTLLLFVLLLKINAETFKLVYLGYRRESSESTVIGATLALEDFQNAGHLTDHTFELSYYSYSGLTKPSVLEVLVGWAINGTLDVILGPISSSLTETMTWSMFRWKIPIFPESATNPSLSNKTKFPNVARTNAPYDKMGPAAVEVMEHFGWNRAAIFTKDSSTCLYGAETMEASFHAAGVLVAAYISHEYGSSWSSGDGEIPLEKIDGWLMYFKERARIIWMCHSSGDVINVMLRAHALGMTNGDYVFIRYDHILSGESDLQPWSYRTTNLTDQEMQERRKAFYPMKMLTMGKRSDDNDEWLHYAAWRLVTDFGFNRSWSESDQMASSGSTYLYDATTLYLMALNATLLEGDNPYNGTAVWMRCRNLTFTGKTGFVSMDEKADRQPNNVFWYNGPDTDSMTASIEFTSGQAFSEVNNTYWATPDNLPPPSSPPCGFQNELCPVDNRDRQIAIVCALFGLLLIITTLLILLHLHRRALLEAELQQMRWKVDYNKINLNKVALSMKSFQSGVDSHQSQLGYTSPTVGTYNGNIVAIRKVHRRSAVILDRDNLLEMKLLREMAHANVNPFVGACVDPLNICILTSYCPKGSLQDILENDDFGLDSTFKCSILMDISDGLQYIHNSPLRSHGHLRSRTCLVDSRWQVKLTSYGLHFLKHGETPIDDDEEHSQMYKKLLWTAPELLRLPEFERPIHGTQKGDIYSLSIIMQEVFYRALPYFMDDLSPKAIVSYLCEQDDSSIYRPDWEPRGIPEDTDPGMITLMTQCWSEKPSARPSLREIRTTIKNTNKGSDFNIMDNMIHKMELYTSNLESIVADRTGEILEEKKKTDVLLCRLLPEVVAEKLKLGQHVESEIYDEATLYFSDVVGFTSLSSKSTPMQIVDLLNDLYTLFDDILNKHDVYKVETIGDAYVVASGLPKRNGNRHAGEIANMSLDLLSALYTSFTVRHIPDMKLRLRIGLHTGPCAAGVVGLTMPRYCVFGETVTFATTMESSGLPMHIHLSPTAYDALLTLPGYITAPRGLMEIQGKGELMTYWLLGRHGYDKPLPPMNE